ncbi:SDR family NAD(P)-dependent oxidoreductase [Pseudohalioglobus sediminis]|nr:SDR family NAD(P)-dependent oxidoreductase [Pseudohalioglobus sediminis]
MSADMATLAGGVAVITGAGSGIGEALARLAAKTGMQVVLADVATARIDAVAAQIVADGGTALAVTADVSDPASMDALAATTRDAFGDVRLLVNNAGVETLGFAWELSAEDWARTLGVNIQGVVNGVRAFAPAMIAAGEQAFIANTASVGALGIMPVQTPYIMSKHAVLAFSECLRLEMELKQAPISVSVVLPGPVHTRIFTDSLGAGDAVSQYHRQQMEGMLAANGISSAEAASRILPQVAAGDFWVSTDAEMTRAYAAGRAQALLDLQPPALAPELAASLQAE